MAVNGRRRRGRPERELDPAAGPVQALAADLRELREKAGHSSYRELARTACYSPTALSRAAAGSELPSLEVTLAFAQACGGDRQEWTARWGRAAQAVSDAGPPEAPPAGGPAAAGPPAEVTAGPGSSPPGGSRTNRGRRRALRLAAGAAAGVLLWAVLASGYWAGDVTDGANPSQAGCAAGSRVLDSQPVRTPAGAVLGSIELRYSPRCAAGWARFIPASGLRQLPPPLITVQVTRPADGKSYQSRYRYTGADVRSRLLLLDQACLQATATITQPGQPLTVRTACQTAP
jgi:Helix-turn-helix domain/Protein of unknown function (DUF2690)